MTPSKNVCPKKRGINLQNNQNIKNLEPFEGRALTTPRPHPKKTMVYVKKWEKKKQIQRKKEKRKKERKLRSPKKTHKTE